MDGRLQSVSAEAYRLFCNAVLWAVTNRSEGHVPGWVVSLIPHATEAAARELARSGLWLDDPRGGWLIEAYEDTQSSLDELDAINARRRADRVRKAPERARKAEERTARETGMSRDQSRDCHAESSRQDKARQGKARQGQDRQGAAMRTGNGAGAPARAQEDAGPWT